MLGALRMGIWYLGSTGTPKGNQSGTPAVAIDTRGSQIGSGGARSGTSGTSIDRTPWFFAGLTEG